MSSSLKLRLSLVLFRLVVVLALAIGLFVAGKDAMKPWLVVGGIIIVATWIATIRMYRTQKLGAGAHG